MWSSDQTALYVAPPIYIVLHKKSSSKFLYSKLSYCVSALYSGVVPLEIKNFTLQLIRNRLFSMERANFDMVWPLGGSCTLFSMLEDVGRIFVWYHLVWKRRKRNVELRPATNTYMILQSCSPSFRVLLVNLYILC
jgi:hypothetical protein